MSTINDRNGSELAITIPSTRGVLRGICHYPHGEAPTEVTAAWPAIVCLHGFTGNHIEQDRLFVQFGRFMSGHGYMVVRVDYFGSGDSDGAFDAFDMTSLLEDVGAIVAWTKQQRQVDVGRIALLGLSLGGCLTCLASAQHRDDIATVILWNAVGLPSRHFRYIPHDGENAYVLNGQRIHPDFLQQFWLADPAMALHLYGKPSLVVYGTADTVIAPQEPAALCEALGSAARRHDIALAGHTFQHPSWRDELFKVTLNWLKNPVA